MVAILDYGIGNVSSIQNMLKKIGVEAYVTADEKIIELADHLILPGVGHFDYCMKQLHKAPFYDLMQKRVLTERVEILGVCVGCQMLMDGSEEGVEAGLGWIKGSVVKFDKELIGKDCKVPHMGWTEITPAGVCNLYNGILNPRYYFVHSYHLQYVDPILVTATANYGYNFIASVRKGNIQGVQFHPEKSHQFGMKLYANFVKPQQTTNEKG